MRYWQATAALVFGMVIVCGCGTGSGSQGFGFGGWGIRGAVAGCSTYSGSNPTADEFEAIRIEVANKQFDVVERFGLDSTMGSRQGYIDVTVAQRYDDIIPRVPDGGFARYTELVCEFAESRNGLITEMQVVAQDNLAALKSNPAFAGVDIEAFGIELAAILNRYPVVSAANPLMLCDLAQDGSSTMTEVIEDMAVTEPELADLNAKSLHLICPDLVGSLERDYSSQTAECFAEVEGQTGTVTITGGDITCAFARSMIAERAGGIGYFTGPDGETWACGSEDILADYECYAVDGPERFMWEAR